MIINAKEKTGPVVLLLLDGWGIAPAGEGNAISQAKTSNFQDLVAKYPSTVLSVAGSGIMAGKKISVADNYQRLGCGRTKSAKDGQCLFDEFDRAAISWLVITEPEKFAYAAYFFAGEKKIKPVNYLLLRSEMADDYSLEPEMAALKITAELLKKIKSRKYRFILADLANLDLVAHGGDFAATVKAVEIIDQAIKNIAKAVLDNSGILIITSPNGNAEEAIEMNTGIKNLRDTDNPVLFLVIGKEFEGKTLGFQEAPNRDLSLVSPGGTLADVAPTILRALGLPTAEGMEGRSFIQ